MGPRSQFFNGYEDYIVCQLSFFILFLLSHFSACLFFTLTRQYFVLNIHDRMVSVSKVPNFFKIMHFNLLPFIKASCQNIMDCYCLFFYISTYSFYYLHLPFLSAFYLFFFVKWNHISSSTSNLMIVLFIVVHTMCLTV